MRRKRLPPILAVAFSSLALFATIWIVVEPPTAILWVFAVASTEWSLYPGFLGLVGALLGFSSIRQNVRSVGIFAIVAGFAAAGLSLIPPIESGPVASANGVMLSLTDYAHFGEAPDAAAIPRTTETYSNAGTQTLKLDIYNPPPTNCVTPMPAVVVVHGGSWRGGHRSDFVRWNHFLAANGYVVFDIDYRLTPQPNWKIACGDVKAAVGWVRRNAKRLGVDPDRIALMGRSAGGQLALLAAYSEGDTSLPPTGAPTDTHVRAVISLYGPTDLVWGYDHTPKPDVIHSHDVLESYLGGSLTANPTRYFAASPIDHVSASTPPTLLFHGGRDLIVGPQHTTMLAERLRRSGVKVESVIIPYALHGFDFNFHGWGAQIVAPVLLRFLHDVLASDARAKQKTFHISYN